MIARRGMFTLIGPLAAAALALTACGGGDNADATPTPDTAAQTQVAENAADRPEWFPAAFPLPARTEVVSETADGAGGGSVSFKSPVPYLRAVQAIDLNMESHGFTVTDRQEQGELADYIFDSPRFTGTLKVTGQGTESLLEVVLVAK